MPRNNATSANNDQVRKQKFKPVNSSTDSECYAQNDEILVRFLTFSNPKYLEIGLI